MKCTDVQDLLIETDDLSTLEGRKEFGNHLTSCPGCNARYRQEQSLKAVFRKFGEAPPPPELARRILEIPQQQIKPLPSPSWFGFPLQFGLSFALILLVAVGLLPWQNISQTAKPEREPVRGQQLAFAPPPSPSGTSMNSLAKDEVQGLREKITALPLEAKKSEVEIPASSAPAEPAAPSDPSEPKREFDLASRLPAPREETTPFASIGGRTSDRIERDSPSSANSGMPPTGGDHPDSHDATKPPAAPTARPIVMASVSRIQPPPVPGKSVSQPILLAAAPQESASVQKKEKIVAKVMGNKVMAPLDSFDRVQLARADGGNAGANAFSETKAPEGEVLLMTDEGPSNEEMANSKKMKEDRGSDTPPPGNQSLVVSFEGVG